MGTAAANLNAAKSLLAENIFCGQTFGLKKRTLNAVTAQLEGGGAQSRSTFFFLFYCQDSVTRRLSCQWRRRHGDDESILNAGALNATITSNYGNGPKHHVAHLNVLPVRFHPVEVNPFMQTAPLVSVRLRHHDLQNSFLAKYNKIRPSEEPSKPRS